MVVANSEDLVSDLMYIIACPRGDDISTLKPGRCSHSRGIRKGVHLMSGKPIFSHGSQVSAGSLARRLSKANHRTSCGSPGTRESENDHHVIIVKHVGHGYPGVMGPVLRIRRSRDLHGRLLALFLPRLVEINQPLRIDGCFSQFLTGTKNAREA